MFPSSLCCFLMMNMFKHSDLCCNCCFLVKSSPEVFMVVVTDHRVQDITPTYFYCLKQHLGGTAVFETER